MLLLWAILFLLALLLAWFANLIGLPGNWLMLLCAIVYWVLIPVDTRLAISTTLLIALAVLAVAGEMLELLASSAGVSKVGGSRRSALFAILGSIGGALCGFLIGVPVPIIGPLIGSLLLGSVGAMAGAMYAERLLGRNWKATFQVGKAAFWGRALGTVVKMLVGLIMLCVALFGMLF
jgi:uncharacterized protein